MKALTAIAVLLCVSAYGQNVGTMQKVEPMTPEEIKQWDDAQAKLTAAQRELVKTREAIGLKHQMAAQSWMEWQSWVDIDGEFIVYRVHSSMTSGLTTTINP